MRLAIVALAVTLAFSGCGEKARAPDTAPFKAALVHYLRTNSMDMKPDLFESLTVKGDKAVAKVRMATKDDLYGMKPLWTVTFTKTAEGWRVINTKR